MDAAELISQQAAAVTAVTAFAAVAITARVFRHGAAGFFSYLNGVLRTMFTKVKGV